MALLAQPGHFNHTFWGRICCVQQYIPKSKHTFIYDSSVRKAKTLFGSKPWNNIRFVPNLTVLSPRVAAGHLFVWWWCGGVAM